MFNKNTLQQLKNDVGEDVLSQLMQVFSAESTKLVQQLNEANNDVHQIQKLAHSLKSCARSYGADQVADIAAEIESLAKLNNIDSNLEKLVLTLTKRHKKTIEQMANFI